MVVKTIIWVQIGPIFIQGSACTFKKVGFVGSFGVHCSIQASRESWPQFVNLYGLVVSHVRDGPHVIAAEGKGFLPRAWGCKQGNREWIKNPHVRRFEVKKVIAEFGEQ